MLDSTILIASGFFVGILAGFIGIGGNVVLIPIILELFRAWGIPAEVRTHLTYGTLLSATVITMISSTWRQHKHGNVLWRITPWIVIGSLIATQALGSTLKSINGITLQLFFASMILILGIKWIISRNHVDAAEPRYQRAPLFLASGLLVGTISLFTGLGGGIILIPLLSTFFHFPTSKLAGTSSAVIIFTAAAAAVSYLWSGAGTVGLPAGTIGFVWPKVALLLAIGTIPGSQIGAILNKKHAKSWFRITFATVQILMALYMFARIASEW